ncbi:MAG: helix-turn-helix transcriptional regulator [Planctomycetaceae bacterium]
MNLPLDPKDREFLQRLNRMGGGTVQEICADSGVTATAVRQRLSRLQGTGLVAREAVREGRGRPHHVYKPTESGLKELGENYADLAMTLWRAVRRIESPEIRELVLNNVREEMVARYGGMVHSGDLSDRFRQLGIGLAEQGFNIEVDTSGELPVLRENNCPYLELANSDAGICELEQAVFADVVGAPVTLSQCYRDGSNCCEFHVQSEAL